MLKGWRFDSITEQELDLDVSIWYYPYTGKLFKILKERLLTKNM
jgi:hypothetical protein